jgi:hypothetical protein
MNIIYIYIYIFILITIILFFSYYNSSKSIENFTPKFREFYRPIIRKTRILGEDYYYKTYSSIQNLFRKFGIM